MGVLTRDATPAFGRRAAAPAPYGRERAITAAAQKVSLGDRNEVQRLRETVTANQIWQSEAWTYYDAIGEVKYTFNLLGNVTGRVRLYAAVPDVTGAVPASVDDVEDLPTGMAEDARRFIARLKSARGGQAALIRNAAINFSVAGECYLVRSDARLGSQIPESWDIRSVDEVRVDAGGKVTVQTRRDEKRPEPMAPNAYLARMWRAHPRYSDEADSSMRGILDPCGELLLINRTFRATARSRLNAGALYLPDGLSTAGTEEVPDELTGEGVPEENDEFETELIDAMVTPITDEDSAAAVVPLIIRGPAELGDKIKQFKFERSFDPALAERSDRLLERILQGIDAPKDIVTGLANVKYSNAVQITESLYKSHVEPLAMLICDSLTTAYLRPHLKAKGYEDKDIARIVIWYDPSDIAIRPDQADDANEGFDRHLLSGEAWRRAHGFSDVDKPTAEETVFRIMMEKGQILPELVEALLQKFAPDLMGQVKTQQAEQSGSPLPPEVQDILQGGDGQGFAKPPVEGDGTEETAPAADTTGGEPA